MYPCRRRYQYAYVSPRTPVWRARCFAVSRAGGVVASVRPLRADQSIKPNIMRAKIGTASSCFAPHWRTCRQSSLLLGPFCVPCAKSFARTKRKPLPQIAQKTQRISNQQRCSCYADVSTSRMHCSSVRAAKSACSSSIIRGGAMRMVFSPAPSSRRPFMNARRTIASRKS